jgi:hypothetical protein
MYQHSSFLFEQSWLHGPRDCAPTLSIANQLHTFLTTHIYVHNPREAKALAVLTNARKYPVIEELLAYSVLENLLQ